MDGSFGSKTTGLIDPINNGAAVAPSDTVDLDPVPRAILVGTSGDLNVTMAEGTAPVLLKNVAAGIPLPIRAKRIHATDTTATDIVALW